MLKKTILGTLVLGMLLAGCGSSSDDDDSDAGGKAGTGAGTSAAGTTAGGGGTGAGTGGAGTNGGDAGINLTCDDTIKGEATCGGTTCTELDQSAKDMCQLTCCTSDNKCGTKNSSMQASMFGFGDCMLPAVEDPRCATQGGFGTPCCTSGGNCGISFQGSACIDPSSFGQGKSRKCDGSDDDDAGM